jgi:hypothetical protein
MYRLDELLGTGDLHLLGPGAMWYQYQGFVAIDESPTWS